jgi:uncharacterized membrane protein
MDTATSTDFGNASKNDFGALPGNVLRGLVLLALILGAFFRFYHLDHKVFWDDEVYSAIRILGYSEADVDRRAGQATDAAALSAILHPNRAAGSSSVSATVGGLASEEPQHAPLYYVLAHYWTALLGNAVVAMRSLSAVAGLLAIPCMFWLCLELFGSRQAGWIGAALVALAPVHVLYSQEAREYALWTVAILAMSAAFVRATRRDTARDWCLYAVLVAVGLYVYPLSAFVALGHVVSLAVSPRWRTPAAALRPIIACLAGYIAFAPWLWIIVRNLEQVDRSMATILAPKASGFAVLRTFFGMLRFNFLDFNIEHATIFNLLISLLPIALVGYAFYMLCRRTPPQTWAFVVVTLVATVAPLVLPDLIFSGLRTAGTRYFMPFYVMVDVALVGLFWLQGNPKFASVRGKPLWIAVFAVVLAGRIASCAVSARSETWWNKFDEKSIAVARVINAANRPVLVSDNYVGYALSLSGYLDRGVRVALRPRCYLCTARAQPGVGIARLNAIGPGDTIFGLGPSPALQDELRGRRSHGPATAPYRCIDVRSNCTSSLALW